eukprot:TRINITY_DN1993_c0_g1_i2.p1 TRINITY_DN1993_c0_g1~~TRINITY_DN1993_c0_g1_i2.p1  ORF type:complete len:359 (-),score=66.83 TRINITY_DN1993_c0_g1_i2:587-1606(-)
MTTSPRSGSSAHASFWSCPPQYPAHDPETRHALEDMVEAFMKAFEMRDHHAIANILHDNVHYMYLGEELDGKEKVEGSLRQYFEQFSEIKLYKRRMLVDTRQKLVGTEFYARWLRSCSPGGMYEERQLAWLFEMKPSTPSSSPSRPYLISRCLLWMDPVYCNHIRDLATPLPTEVWTPSLHPGTPLSQPEVDVLIQKKVDAFSREDVNLWLCLVDDDVIMHPPWDILRGKMASTEGILTYFQNYHGTQVTSLLTLSDETQPQFFVHHQIFHTTNRKSHKAGDDVDYVFGEVCNGRIRYWRTYFDTKASVQKAELTHGFSSQSSQIEKCILRRSVGECQE